MPSLPRTFQSYRDCSTEQATASAEITSAPIGGGVRYVFEYSWYWVLYVSLIMKYKVNIDWSFDYTGVQFELSTIINLPRLTSETG